MHQAIFHAWLIVKLLKEDGNSCYFILNRIDDGRNILSIAVHVLLISIFVFHDKRLLFGSSRLSFCHKFLPRLALSFCYISSFSFSFFLSHCFVYIYFFDAVDKMWGSLWRLWWKNYYFSFTYNKGFEFFFYLKFLFVVGFFHSLKLN